MNLLNVMNGIRTLEANILMQCLEPPLQKLHTPLE